MKITISMCLITLLVSSCSSIPENDTPKRRKTRSLPEQRVSVPRHIHYVSWLEKQDKVLSFDKLNLSGSEASIFYSRSFRQCWVEMNLQEYFLENGFRLVGSCLNKKGISVGEKRS